MNTKMTISLEDLLLRIRDLEPLIREYAPVAESECRMSEPVADAVRDAGLFRMFRPKSLGGGLGLDPTTGFRVIEELARIDSAVAWNVAIANASEVFGAWYSDEVTEPVFGSPNTVMAGAWNPPRRAVPVDGGYKITGRTLFSSNCHAATWLLGLAHIYDGEVMRTDETGAPVTLLTLMPMSDARIVENWDTLGMRGTGSHDLEIDAAFVPAERAVPLSPMETPGPAYSGAFSRLLTWPAIAVQAAPALGIARVAIDAFIELATAKTPSFTTKTLRDRPIVQLQLARAEAKLSAARALLYSVLDEMWARACDGAFVDMNQRARCQLAASHAVTAAAEAVDLVHTAAGASAIRNDQPFQRFFRDVHVITQHAFVSENRLDSVGQIMMGLEPEWPFFAVEPRN